MNTKLIAVSSVVAAALALTACNKQPEAPATDAAYTTTAEPAVVEVPASNVADANIVASTVVVEAADASAPADAGAMPMDNTATATAPADNAAMPDASNANTIPDASKQ